MVRGFTSVLILCFLVLSSDNVFAYSYAEAEDPMVAVFKLALVAARENRWDEVKHQAKEGLKLQEGHKYDASYLFPQIEDVIAQKDVSKTAEVFANLVYLSINEKFYINKKEKFANHKNTKARLQLAYKSYIDVFDGNVKKQDNSRSEAIIKQFKIALDSIGNPGLFGIGKRSPAPDKYDSAVKVINKLMVETFPSFGR